MMFAMRYELNISVSVKVAVRETHVSCKNGFLRCFLDFLQKTNQHSIKLRIEVYDAPINYPVHLLFFDQIELK